MIDHIKQNNKVVGAEALLRNGSELIDTFIILSEKKQSLNDYSNVKHFLLARALEDLLKAFLLFTQDYSSAKELKNKFGSDLSKLAHEIAKYKNNSIVPVYKILHDVDIRTIETINKVGDNDESQMGHGGDRHVNIGLLFDTTEHIKNKVRGAIDGNTKFSKED